MSLIVSEVYDALIDAGATEEKAKAAASAIPLAEGLATKEDIAELRAATKEDIAELRAATKEDIAELKAATKEDIAELKVANREDIFRLEAATSEKFAKLDKDVAVLKLAVFTFEPAVLVLLVKLIFFP